MLEIKANRMKIETFLINKVESINCEVIKNGVRIKGMDNNA